MNSWMEIGDKEALQVEGGDWWGLVKWFLEETGMLDKPKKEPQHGGGGGGGQPARPTASHCFLFWCW